MRAESAKGWMRRALPHGFRARMALAAASGAGLTLAQPPISFWPALFIAWPLLFVLIRTIPDPRQAAWTGWFAGAGFFATSLYWIGEAFLVEAGKIWWYAPVMPLAIALLTSMLALFWAAAFWAGRKLWREGWRGAIVLAGAVGAVEVARGFVLTGFPWGLQGYAWIETPVMQAASLIGVQALSVLTIAAAALPATARIHAPWPALAAAALVAGGWVWGAQRLEAAPEPEADAPVLRLVQPNIGQRDKWAPENRLPIFERLLTLSAVPARGGRPALVVWPEVAVTFLFDQSPDAIARSVQAASGATLALGAVRSDADGRLRNSLLVYGDDDAQLWVYDKRRLAPFGEYVPYAWVLERLGIGTLGDGLSGFAPGDAAGPFALPGLPPVAPLICYEAIFPADTRRAAQGAGWMLQITNDSWFGESAGPWQHLAKARTRAIELGLPLARAANTGISAMIDARGRVLESLPLDARGVLDSPLPPAEARPTLYARIGDAPLFAFLAILLGGVIAMREKSGA